MNEAGHDFDHKDTAVVFIDPQNDVLSEKAAAWAAVADSVPDGVAMDEHGQPWKDKMNRGGIT